MVHFSTYTGANTLRLSVHCTPGKIIPHKYYDISALGQHTKVVIIACQVCRFIVLVLKLNLFVVIYEHFCLPVGGSHKLATYKQAGSESMRRWMPSQTVEVVMRSE